MAKSVRIFKSSEQTGENFYEAGKNGVKNITFHARTVKIEFDDGRHTFIVGFPFEFTSTKPIAPSDRELLGD